MSTPSPKSVLILGGSGSLGSRTARFLRRLHPGLPITIAGRDLAKAARLAAEIGNADAVSVDIERADLGLPPETEYSIVVTAVRDRALNALRYAEARNLPYLALSDGAFEVGPLVARHVHMPHASPVVLLGHSMGGVPALAAIHFARSFKRIESIEIGLVFDPDDHFGPASAADVEHIVKNGPRPLALVNGQWHWLSPDEAKRRFTGVGGHEHDGETLGLMDLLSLWPSTGAESIRIDMAVGPTDTTRRGLPLSNEVIIEITGERDDGSHGRHRYELVDTEGYAALSARGVAVCVERLLGLTGEAPPTPGLYLPEVLINPAHLMQRLTDFGVILPPLARDG